MRNAVIVEYLRSPFTRAGKGEFAMVRPDDLAGHVLKEIVAKSKINPADIEDVKLGCAFPEGEQGLNIGRQIVFIAGLPNSIAGTTLNRFCGSSMQTIHDAVGAIALGAGDVFVCGGVESMTRIPMGGLNPARIRRLFEKTRKLMMAWAQLRERLAVQI
jgi:acetyl-CoA acyltransferase